MKKNRFKVITIVHDNGWHELKIIEYTHLRGEYPTRKEAEEAMEEIKRSG